MNIISPTELCKMMGCSRNTLKKRIKQNIYPRPIKNNMRLGFNSEQVKEFFNNKFKQSFKNGQQGLRWE